MMMQKIHSTKQQKGVALVIALVLLVVVTLVGLAAIRGTSLQEKMAGNTLDRAQAFQVAEATLELAARSILPPAAAPVSSNYNVQGVTDCATAACSDNPAASIPNASQWQKVSAIDGSGAVGNTTNIVSIYGNKPSYLIQYMGNCSSSGTGNFVFTNDQNEQGGGGSMKTSNTCYRITARAGGAADRAQIVLQAVYRAAPG